MGGVNTRALVKPVNHYRPSFSETSWKTNDSYPAYPHDPETSWNTNDSYPDACLDPLGLEKNTNNTIEHTITASTEATDNKGIKYSAHRARLNDNLFWAPFWAPSISTGLTSWIQMAFDRPVFISGIVTQGSTWWEYWVTSLKVMYKKRDGSSFHTINETFAANTDEKNPQTILFKEVIEAVVVRLKPLTWNKGIGMRLEILGCQQACQDPLGLEDGSIPDASITASSERQDPNDDHYFYRAFHGRLNSRWFWAPNGVDQSTSWIQVEFGRPRHISGIVTQGSTWWNEWVKTLNVLYKVDRNDTFHTIPEKFNANTDSSTPRTIWFEKPIEAVVVRVKPLTWNHKTGMRLEILGCQPG